MKFCTGHSFFQALRELKDTTTTEELFERACEIENMKHSDS